MDVLDAFRGMGSMRLCGDFTVTRAFTFGMSGRGGFDDCSGSLDPRILAAVWYSTLWYGSVAQSLAQVG
jgi:hypothetical protein